MKEIPIVAIAIGEQYMAAAVSSACCLRSSDKSHSAFTLLGQSKVLKPVCTYGNEIGPAERQKVQT